MRRGPHVERATGSRVGVVRIKGHIQKTETERGRNSEEGRAQREKTMIKRREGERRRQLESTEHSGIIVVRGQDARRQAWRDLDSLKALVTSSRLSS